MKIMSRGWRHSLLENKQTKTKKKQKKREIALIDWKEKAYIFLFVSVGMVLLFYLFSTDIQTRERSSESILTKTKRWLQVISQNANKQKYKRKRGSNTKQSDEKTFEKQNPVSIQHARHTTYICILSDTVKYHVRIFFIFFWKNSMTN